MIGAEDTEQGRRSQVSVTPADKGLEGTHNYTGGPEGTAVKPKISRETLTAEQNKTQSRWSSLMTDMQKDAQENGSYFVEFGTAVNENNSDSRALMLKKPINMNGEEVFIIITRDGPKAMLGSNIVHDIMNARTENPPSFVRRGEGFLIKNNGSVTAPEQKREVIRMHIGEALAKAIAESNPYKDISLHDKIPPIELVKKAIAESKETNQQLTRQIEETRQSGEQAVELSAFITSPPSSTQFANTR